MTKLIVYVSILILISCFMFFIGFFPMKPVLSEVSSTLDLPKLVVDHRLAVNKLYRRQYEKVVLMIVDALRLDFISNEEYMPFLSKVLRNKSSSCFMALHTEAPTVTLPRIKAIVTGTAPGFLDVLYNFGSNVIVGDSVISQAHNHGHRIAFYGDDTWLSLFPKAFMRYEGTSSFFVNDFDEVDANVTKNLKKELIISDWDLLILHYLGLDHIGHVEGPYSKLIPHKLKEMDDVVQKIVNFFEPENGDGSFKGLLLITGDHGMKNSGGHGGSSYEEVTVPVVLINGNCNSLSKNSVFNQVDIAPFLATILGVPIPTGSIGQLDPKWLGSLHSNESLYATFYNTIRMKRDFSADWTDEMEAELKLGIKYYSSWIKKDFNSDDDKKAATHFLRSQKKISSIRSKTNEINFIPVSGAVLLLVQALIFLFVDVNVEFSRFNAVCGTVTNRINGKLLMFSLLIACSLVALIIWCLGNPAMKPFHLDYLITVIAALLIGCNIRLLQSVKLTFKALTRMGLCYLPMVILHPFIFISTSFIEEEHHFWYFSFATLLTCILLGNLRALDSVLVILLIQRFFNTLNKNGDKWSHLPALGDWLESDRNQHYLVFLYITGLLFSIMANVKYSVHRGKLVSLDVAFTIVQVIMVYLYNRAIQRITVFPPFYPKSSGKWEVKIFWICVLCKSVPTLSEVMRNRIHSLSPFNTSKLYALLLQLHLSVHILLVKPRNILLAPALVLFSSMLFKTARNSSQLQVMHYWLGMVFYFYMGNTNSISSIDVSVAFVGLDEFNFLLAGLFVCLHTYAYPILSFLISAAQLQKKSRANKNRRAVGHEFCSTYLLLNGLPLLVLMILIVIQREHLFIWSVFSPKLLYLIFQNVLFIFLVLFYCLLDETN